jgi:hypothetical protein
LEGGGGLRFSLWISPPPGVTKLISPCRFVVAGFPLVDKLKKVSNYRVIFRVRVIFIIKTNYILIFIIKKERI